MTESNELSKKEIKKLINKDNPIIIEVGAYDGADSRELNKLYEHAICFCFEADPRSQKLFIKMNSRNTLILEKYAVGSIDGEVDFYTSDSDTRRHKHNTHSWSASSSLKKPKTHLQLFKDVQFKDCIKVNSIKLDTWYRENIVKDIVDFIWVDINGAEEDFILGASKTLKEKTRFLYIEFSDKELYENQITKDKMLELLPDFELLSIHNFKGNFGNLLLKNKTL